MIASWIANRMVRSAFDKMSQDDFDADALMAGMPDDVVLGHPSHLGVGETVKGKKANADYLRRWQKEYPQREFQVKSICWAAWPLSPSGVCMVDWTFTETNREGIEYKYDGASVMHIRNFKPTHVTDYISFKGLPQLSTLIKPSGKA